MTDVDARALVKALGVLPGELRQALLERVMPAIGQHVQDGAAARSRVDTGAMRAGWTHEVGVNATGPYVDVTNPVAYTAAHEYGTDRMSPQPMIRPAASDEVERIRRGDL